MDEVKSIIGKFPARDDTMDVGMEAKILNSIKLKRWYHETKYIRASKSHRAAV